MQNLVALSHTMCAHVGGHKKWGRWSTTPLGCGEWLKLTPRNTLLHHMLSYQISPIWASVRVGWALALWTVAWLFPLVTRSYPHTCYHFIFGRSRSNCLGVGMGGPKIWVQWGPVHLRQYSWLFIDGVTPDNTLMHVQYSNGVASDSVWVRWWTLRTYAVT